MNKEQKLKSFRNNHILPFLRDKRNEFEAELCFLEEHFPDIPEREILNDLAGKIEGFFDEIDIDIEEVQNEQRT